MAFTVGPKTGLPTNIDLGDLTWTQKYLDGNKELEERISKRFSGNPNGNVVGDFYGQTCQDTSTGEMYECGLPGAKDVAEWYLKAYVEVGTIQFFMRKTLPDGWLALNGQSVTGYPRLLAVIPDGWRTGNTIVLPDWRNKPVWFRSPSSGGVPALGNSVSTPAAQGTDYQQIITVTGLWGIKY